MNEEFDIKLQCIILYITHFVLQLKLPSTDNDVQLVTYEDMHHRLTQQLLNKNMKFFYKLYKECQQDYMDRIKKVFTDEYYIHQYTYYMVASHLIEYLSLYSNKILDIFYRIITKN